MSTHRVLIWAKTYPELSERYKETVCTAGCFEDGSPVRIYPVPLRYLGDEMKYRLYNWIDVDLIRDVADGRPESYKLAGNIKITGHIDTKANWRLRRNIVFQDKSWHYDCLDHLKEAQKRDRLSLGCVRVGEVTRIWVKDRDEERAAQHKLKLRKRREQGEMFVEDQPPVKDLAFQHSRVHVAWKCHCIHSGQECKGHTAGSARLGFGRAW